MSSARPSIKRPVVIAITGGSGAGKTWLARRLMRRFGGQAVHWTLDDFYRDRSCLSPGQRARINFDHPRAIDWPCLERVLRTIRAGGEPRMPRYDFSRHTRRRQLGRTPLKPLIILEGLWLLRRPALRRLFAWSIYIDCPENHRFRQRLRRDQAERGRTPESVRRQFYQTVAPMHRRFVAPQERWADLVVRAPLSDAVVHAVTMRLRARLKTPNLRRDAP